MNLLSPEIQDYTANSSMIRKMFEAGIELKKQYGADQVFDFSLGNPDLAPPASVKKALQDLVKTIDKPFSIGYMPNAGYADTREVLAEKVSEEQQVKTPASNIIVTCGAAGGLNIFFRAVLSPGDEVMCPSPFFVEYGFYAGNFGGKLVPVKTKLPSFSLDIAAMEKAITPKTRAVIIASGSEVQLALKAQALLAAQKIAVRVVSMPSTSAFDRQSVQYKQSVLPAGLPRIAVEMGVTDGWWKYGCAAVVGIDRYGESAPAGKLFEFFGLTPENVADTVRAVLGR